MDKFEDEINEVVNKITESHTKLLMLGVDYPKDFSEALENGEIYYSVSEFIDDGVMKKCEIESYDAQDFLTAVKNDMLEMIRDLINGIMGDTMGCVMFEYITSNIKFYGKIRTGESWTLEMGIKAADAYRAEYEKAMEKEKLKNEFKAV